MIKEISDFKTDFARSLTEDFNNLPLDYQFDYIKKLIRSSYSDGIESNTSPHRALLIKLGHAQKTN